MLPSTPPARGNGYVYHVPRRSGAQEHGFCGRCACHSYTVRNAWNLTTLINSSAIRKVEPALLDLTAEEAAAALE